MRQLHTPRASEHPTHGAMLPPPVSIDPLEDVPAGMLQHYRASEAGRIYAATERDLTPPHEADA